MRKDSYTVYDYARRYSPELSPEPTFDDEVMDSESKKPEDSILNLVYAPDPRTGLPTGDLVYLVSDKANPQVKEFILKNLMMDTSSAANVVVPAELSDDDAFALTRQKDESVDAYAQRLNESVQRDRWLIQEAKEKQNVSSQSK